jgi:hypothetical protein
MMPMRAVKSFARCAPSRSRILTSAASAWFQRLFHGRPDIFRAHQFLIRLENARRAQQLVQRHLAGKFQLFGQPRQFRGVSLGERQLMCIARGQLALGGVDADDARVTRPRATWR